jgi:hypothetical protein
MKAKTVKVITVEVRCTIRKSVTCENCTLEEAKKSPWEFATDEIETDMEDWEVLSAKEEQL